MTDWWYSWVEDDYFTKSIVVSAGGNAEVRRDYFNDAKVKYGGSVFAYGKPKQQ
jgi:hypothetical protein